MAKLPDRADQRAQVRRESPGTTSRIHPLGIVAAVAKLFDDLESLGEILRLLLGSRLREILAELSGQLVQVEFLPAAP